MFSLYVFFFLSLYTCNINLGLLIQKHIEMSGRVNQILQFRVKNALNVNAIPTETILQCEVFVLIWLLTSFLWLRTIFVFLFFFFFMFPSTESWPCSCSTGYYLRSREGHRLFQALYDTWNKYFVPQAQWYKPRRLLLPESSLPWYLDVYSAGLLGCQLCALCHSQVTCSLLWFFWQLLPPFLTNNCQKSQSILLFLYFPWDAEE